MTASPLAYLHVCCLDCGFVCMKKIAPEEAPTWRCHLCLARAGADQAPRDEAGHRVCKFCGKRLARLNRGPECFACGLAGLGKEPPPEPVEREHPKRQMVPCMTPGCRAKRTAMVHSIAAAGGVDAWLARYPFCGPCKRAREAA